MSFFKNAFERRISDLAARAGLKIAESHAEGAKLRFSVGSHSQPLTVIPFDNVWEFSCPSLLAFDSLADFPQVMLVAVLEVNAKNKRGFWCIETLGGKKVLEYMHNVMADTLTPSEFSEICWGVVKEVERFEEACRGLVR